MSDVVNARLVWYENLLVKENLVDGKMRFVHFSASYSSSKFGTYL